MTKFIFLQLNFKWSIISTFIEDFIKGTPFNESNLSISSFFPLILQVFLMTLEFTCAISVIAIFKAVCYQLQRLTFVCLFEWSLSLKKKNMGIAFGILLYVWRRLTNVIQISITLPRHFQKIYHAWEQFHSYNTAICSCTMKALTGTELSSPWSRLLHRGFSIDHGLSPRHS